MSPAAVSSPTYDYVVIGGGIIGLATAWQLKQRLPDARIVLFEKETALARHQTGHNSGVIHSGIYYAPGSLKARLCRAGVAATVQLCDEADIPYEQCGKLLVATDDIEHERMLALYERSREHDLDAELIDAPGLRKLEPAVAGRGAIRVPSTGIVDFGRVATAMAEGFRRLGGEVRLGMQVTALAERYDSVQIDTADGHSVLAAHLVACAGLASDRVARMLGVDTDFRIIPYRGEYYRLPDEKRTLVRHLIYPIPDPALPFLGVHLTRMIDGKITVGPNAVQGFKREGYGRINVSLRDTADMLCFPGFWRVTGKHLRAGLEELANSWFKRGYLRQVQKYCPSIQLADLLPYPAGVRAQAVLRDGTLVHDFLFAESPHGLIVCNAPSPGATASIPIGGHICDRLLAKTRDGATQNAPSGKP